MPHDSPPLHLTRACIAKTKMCMTVSRTWGPPLRFFNATLLARCSDSPCQGQAQARCEAHPSAPVMRLSSALPGRLGALGAGRKRLQVRGIRAMMPCTARRTGGIVTSLMYQEACFSWSWTPQGMTTCTWPWSVDLNANRTKSWLTWPHACSARQMGAAAARRASRRTPKSPSPRMHKGLPAHT